MVSETGDGRTYVRRATTREARLEGLGMCSIALGAASLVVFFVPDMSEAAILPGLAAFAIGSVDLSLKVSRRRYALAGMILGTVGLLFAVGMMLFGSVN